MARRPEYLRSQVADAPKSSRVTWLTPGRCRDWADPVPSLPNALRGVHTAYYLIHSLASSSDYAEKDRKGAELFAKAAREAGVRRLVYLGGLGQGERLSLHLASRQEIGRILPEWASRRSSSAPRS